MKKRFGLVAVFVILVLLAACNQPAHAASPTPLSEGFEDGTLAGWNVEYGDVQVTGYLTPVNIDVFNGQKMLVVGPDGIVESDPFVAQDDQLVFWIYYWSRIDADEFDGEAIYQIKVDGKVAITGYFRPGSPTGWTLIDPYVTAGSTVQIGFYAASKAILAVDTYVEGLGRRDYIVQVLNSRGQPVDGATIWLYRAYEGATDTKTFTSNGGMASFAVWDRGRYYARADYWDGKTLWSGWTFCLCPGCKNPILLQPAW